LLDFFKQHDGHSSVDDNAQAMNAQATRWSIE